MDKKIKNQLDKEHRDKIIKLFKEREWIDLEKEGSHLVDTDELLDILLFTYYEAKADGMESMIEWYKKYKGVE